MYTVKTDSACSTMITSSSAIADRRAAGCIIVWAKSGREEIGDNILRTL